MTMTDTRQPAVLHYKHPQGKRITVTDGVVVCTKAGKIVKTSATADKLAVGYGGWEPADGPDDGAPVAALPTKVEVAQATGHVVRPPMRFESAEVSRLMDFTTDDAWYLQQKLDGIRAMLVFPRHGDPYFRSSDGSPLVSAAVTKVTRPIVKIVAKSVQQQLGVTWVKEWALDGEIIGGVFHVFDIVDDHNPARPLSERLDGLAEWAAGSSWGNATELIAAGLVRVLPTARDTLTKQRLGLAVLEMGGEGWIAKRADSPYSYGARVTHSLKLKRVSTVDAVVVRKNDKGKANYILGVYRDGELVEIGQASAIGKVDVPVHSVLEVRYLYAGANGRLVQPTVLRARPDKAAIDCSYGQLRFVNKDVLSF